MSDRADGPTRRDALRVGALVGLSGGLSALLGGLPRPAEAATKRAAVAYDLHDPATQVATTCAGCLGACPVRGTRSEGIVAKVDGSPWTPRQGGDPVPRDADHAAVLRGSSCARGQSRVNNIHDPWRLMRPLIREGDRGSMRFRTASAEAWLATLVDGPTGLRALEAELRGAPADAPPGLLIAVDPRHQDRRDSLQAFAAAFSGSRAILGHPAPSLAAATAAVGAPGRLAAPRWERSTLAIAWGADPMASGLDPVGSMRALAGQRKKLVAIDPRLSSTAGMSGTWLPVRPGTDRLLVAWIRRILDESLPPSARLATDDPVRTLPTGELEHQIGLGAELVEKLALRMREAGPGLAIGIGGGLDPETTRAVLALCRALGALDPGGAMAPAADPTPIANGPRALVEALRADAPPRIAVIAGDGGLVGTRWLPEALELLRDPARVRQVVVLGLAPDPLFAVADLVLPDVTEFERSGVVRRHDGSSVSLPVIAPIPSEIIDGPLGRGLEGLLEAMAAATGLALPDPGFAAAVNAAAAELPRIAAKDDAILTAALQGRVPDLDRIDARGRSLLLRGHAPPHADEVPLGPAVATADPPPTAPVEGVHFVGWTEIFGGQADSAAQVWGAAAIRSGNVALVHPEMLTEIPGDPSSHVRISAGSAAIVLPLQTGHGLRRGVVAVARGYGQTTGYDGHWVVDGSAIEGSPRRCAGAPIEALLAADGPVELSWAAPPPSPSWFARLAPGGRS